MEWSEFTQRLGRELAGLDRDTILIVRERAESRHYVQAMREPDRLYAEAVSNHFLEGPLLLTPADEEVLREVGWRPPGDPTPRNWWTDLPGNATPGDHFRLADMMVQALRDVQGVRRPADLVYESFHRLGNGLIELLGFGIPPADPSRVVERRTTPDPVAPRVADPVLSAPALPEEGPHAAAPGLRPAAPPVAGAGPASGDLEHALTDAKQRGDHAAYFDLLLRSDLVLPLPQGPGAPELVTTTIGGATYVLAFSSTQALTAALSPRDPSSPPPHRRVSFGALAASWPDPSWSLAINTGLPSEMHLDAVAIARLDHSRRAAEQATAEPAPAPSAGVDAARDLALPEPPPFNGGPGPAEESPNGLPSPPGDRVEPSPGGPAPFSPNGLSDLLSPAGPGEPPPLFPGAGAPGVPPSHDAAAEAAQWGTHAHGLPDLPLPPERPQEAAAASTPPPGGQDLPRPGERPDSPPEASDRGVPAFGPFAPPGRDGAPPEPPGLSTAPHGLPDPPAIGDRPEGAGGTEPGGVPALGAPGPREEAPREAGGSGTPPFGAPSAPGERREGAGDGFPPPGAAEAGPSHAATSTGPHPAEPPSPEGAREPSAPGVPPQGTPQPAPAENAGPSDAPHGASPEAAHGAPHDVPHDVPAPPAPEVPHGASPAPAEGTGPLPDLEALTRLAVRSESTRPETPASGAPSPVGPDAPPQGPSRPPQAAVPEEGRAEAPPYGPLATGEQGIAAPAAVEEGAQAAPDPGVVPPLPRRSGDDRPEPKVGERAAMRLPHGVRLWVDAGDGGEPRPVAVYDAASGGWTPVPAT